MNVIIFLINIFNKKKVEQYIKDTLGFFKTLFYRIAKIKHNIYNIKYYSYTHKTRLLYFSKMNIANCKIFIFLNAIKFHSFRKLKNGIGQKYLYFFRKKNLIHLLIKIFIRCSYNSTFGNINIIIFF